VQQCLSLLKVGICKHEYLVLVLANQENRRKSHHTWQMYTSGKKCKHFHIHPNRSSLYKVLAKLLLNDNFYMFHFIFFSILFGSCIDNGSASLFLWHLHFQINQLLHRLSKFSIMFGATGSSSL